MEYELEKHIWTDADFEQMGWHDNHIHQIRLSDKLELDIDYILKWNEPEMEGLSFTFWIAPATLVFESVKMLSFDIAMEFADTIEIAGIEREVLNSGTRWTISTQQGEFVFLSSGYTQYIRQNPFFTYEQIIGYIERNGISLEHTTNQHNPNRFREDVVSARNKKKEDYENYKSRHITINEARELELQKERSEIDLKTFIIKKNEIKERIEYYNSLLKNTTYED